jgi:hypothetical protein
MKHIHRTCGFCNREFEPNTPRIGIRPYCSRACYFADWADPAKTAARFWQRATRRDNGCRVWTGQLTEAGYGRFPIGGKHRLAHRVAWTLANDRAIPAGMFVCHHCDNPACVEPSHLFLGTHTDNMHDMLSKGRQGARPCHTHPERIARGTRMPNAKLTDEAVRELRTLRRSGASLRVICARFGIAPSVASRAANGSIWKHVR